MWSWKETIVCLLVVFHSANAIQCLGNYCDQVDCGDGLTAEFCAGKGAVLREKSSFCGCCNTCVSQLAEGESCRFSLLLGLPSTLECAEGLICNSQTFKCQKVQSQQNYQATGPCSIKQAAVDKNDEESIKKTGHAVLGAPQLKCTDAGDYAGRQCSGSQCYCVDKEGNNIGYSHYRWLSKEDINCECARKKDEIRKSGLIGRMMSCDKYGDFEDIQCTGSVCYCVERKLGKKLTKDGVNIGELGSLNC